MVLPVRLCIFAERGDCAAGPAFNHARTTSIGGPAYCRLVPCLRYRRPVLVRRGVKGSVRH